MKKFLHFLTWKREGESENVRVFVIIYSSKKIKFNIKNGHSAIFHLSLSKGDLLFTTGDLLFTLIEDIRGRRPLDLSKKNLDDGLFCCLFWTPF